MKFRSLLTLSLLVFSTFALAQNAQSAPPSDAEKSFDAIKNLAGTWNGKVTMNPKMEGMDDTDHLRVTMRVTSRGHALVHEIGDTTTSDDPTKHDHPVTMFYLDSNRLLLTHYCDAGNRPRMVAQKVSPDGKRLEFDFLDLSGPNDYGHMYHAVFTIIDSNHHTEDWTYLMPGDKPMQAHMELQRGQ
jgi:hypothetical protein